MFKILLLVSTRNSLGEEYRAQWPFFMFSGGASDQLAGYSIATEGLEEGAYNTNQKVPSSCDCWETGRAWHYSKCDIFECTCICDLTAGACDHNCCCDRECSDFQRERFDAIQACLPEGPQHQETTKCYSREDVDRVNPKFPLSIQGTAQGSVDRMLCVQYDNSHFQGKFYKDANLLNPSNFDKVLAQSELGYSQWKASLPIVATSNYDSGDAIGVIFSNSEVDFGHDNSVAAFAGSLPLPTNTQLGECSDFGLAQFSMPIVTQCIRVHDVESLIQACNMGILGSGRFTTKISVGSRFTTSFGGISSLDGGWIDVKVRSVSWKDFDTGEFLIRQESTSRFRDDEDCQAVYDSGEVSLAPSASSIQMPSNSEGTGGLSCNSWDGRPPSPACRNALASIRYTMRYEEDTESKGKQKIVAADADIVLTDIPATAVGTDGVVVLQQEYSTHFTSMANRTFRTKSGNPGYIFGRRLAVGTLQITATGLEFSDLGVLGSIEDGACTNTMKNMVSFGLNAHSGCLLNLNRSELRDFCVGRGPHAASKGLPRYFNASNIFDANFKIIDYHVGMFGNADGLDSSHWLKIETRPIAPKVDVVEWEERSGTCKNAITSMNYRFVWTHVGSHSNPQAKIIGARMDFGTSNINYFHNKISGVRQSISIGSTVTFVKRESDLVDYSPPSPSVAISVPHDVWYPFKIDSHGIRRNIFLSSSWTFFVTCLVIAQ